MGSTTSPSRLESVLIRTKLTRPPLHAGLVRRQRRVERLAGLALTK